MASRYKGLITYGIRANVKTLGPDGLIEIHVCCELCDIIMHAIKKKNIDEPSAWVLRSMCNARSYLHALKYRKGYMSN